MKNRKPLLILSITFIFMGCTKKTSSCYYTDRTFYHAGDVIQLNNCSTNAESYEWTFPDGSTSTEKNPVYKIDSALTGISFEISLKAYSKWGKKYAKTYKTFKLSETVFPDDFYIFPAAKCVPDRKIQYPSPKNNTYIILLETDVASPRRDTYSMSISFKGLTRPVPGSYSVASGEVSVECGSGSDGVYSNLIYYSTRSYYGGEVVVSATSTNRLKIYFYGLRVAPNIWSSSTPFPNHISANVYL